MKIKILTLGLILLSLYSRSQDVIEKDVVGKMTVVKASISNMKNLFRLSDANLDSTLTKMGYSKNEAKDGTISFIKGTVPTGGRHLVSKKSSYISIRWYHEGNSNRVLNSLLKELQPFYDASMENARIYKIMDGDITYRFIIMGHDAWETVQMIQSGIVTGQQRGRIIQVPTNR